MNATMKPLLERTAGDLMSREPLAFSADMPLRDAARALLQAQIEGAPVVDADGKCIGVLAAVDFVRLFQAKPDVEHHKHGARPVTCRFQAKLGSANGREKTLCLLPPGACPLQEHEKQGRGDDLVLCREPHCVLVDWQVVELEHLPEIPVRRFMTPDPVMINAEAPIQELARKMVDAHIHRMIVVDAEQKPVGVVSVTDILAAVAYAE